MCAFKSLNTLPHSGLGHLPFWLPSSSNSPLTDRGLSCCLEECLDLSESMSSSPTDRGNANRANSSKWRPRCRSSDSVEKPASRHKAHSCSSPALDGEM